MNKRSKDQVQGNRKLHLLLSELAKLRRELRETLHAYEARLEIALAETISCSTALETAKRLPRERIEDVDNLILLLRKRRLKPEKGRRKDLRKIENLINDLHAALLPGL